MVPRAGLLWQASRQAGCAGDSAFVVVVLFFALLIAYPWPVLTTGTILYLGSLPFGFMSYRNHQRRDVSVPAQQPAAAAAADATVAVAAPPTQPAAPSDPDRPARLN
jgi:CDP-diacylglycerol--serine O-phosphatidyltransferase